MPVVEGEAPFEGFSTWYRVTGSIGTGLTPLVVAHGGPGCTHGYVDSFKDLAASGLAVIHDDQIGNGRSTHLPDRGGDVWTVDSRCALARLRGVIAYAACQGARPLYGRRRPFSGRS